MKTLRPITHTLLQPSPLRASNTTCRAAFLPSRSTRPRQSSQPQQHRAFVSTPFSGPQTITASRTLAYPQRAIFDVIADVSAYHNYLPYCRESSVTKHSSPASNGVTYPEEGKLTIGFNEGVSEEFWSRVYCVPYEVVEAVSGQTNTTLDAASITHHGERSTDPTDRTRGEAVLTHLLTRWTLRPFMYKPPPVGATHPAGTHKNHDETNPIPSREKTDVSLLIEYQFANPVYAALSQAAAPKVAEKMIEAFEKRVREVCEGPGHVRL